MRLEMAAYTPALEEGEKERVRKLRAARLHDALEKQRRQIFAQLREMMRRNFILFICGIAMAAFFYHRLVLNSTAANVTRAVSSKIDTAEKSSNIHQAILAEEQNVDLASEKK